MRSLSVAVLLALSIAAPAGAQPKGYEKQYKDALKLENDGALVDALAGFEAIPVEKRDWATRMHIAACKKKLGRLLEAAQDYDAIRKDPSANAAMIETASSDYDDVVARTPKLVIKTTAATTGVKVTLDGAEVSPPATKMVNPGAHSIVATRGAETVFQREVTLAESTTLQVEVDAPPPAAAPVAAAAPVQPSSDQPPPSPASSSTQRTWGFVALGVGGALAVGAGVSWLVGNGAYQDWRASCAPRTGCDADKESTARRWDGIALGTGIAGAVALAGGAILVLTAPRATNVEVKAAAGAFNGLVVEGRF